MSKNKRWPKVLDEANNDIDTVVADKTAELQKKVAKLRAVMAQLEAVGGSPVEGESTEERKRKLAEVNACSLVMAKRLKSSETTGAGAGAEPGKENQVCLDNTSSTVNSTVLT